MKPKLVRPYPPSLDTRKNIFKVARFKVLYGRIDTEPERVDSIVKACTVLHNFLCDENVSSDEYAPADDGSLKANQEAWSSSSAWVGKAVRKQSV